MGTIGFEHLKISCHLGVEDLERQFLQDIYVDLYVEVDFAKSASTDSLKDTISYVFLSEMCIQIAQNKPFHLMESLANEILDSILKEYAIDTARIRIKKPNAIANAQNAVVELARGRKWLGH